MKMTKAQIAHYMRTLCEEDAAAYEATAAFYDAETEARDIERLETARAEETSWLNDELATLCGRF